MTDLKPTPTRQPNPGKPSRWRGPAIALGIAAAILLVVGVVSALVSEDDGIPPAGPAETPTVSEEMAMADPLDVVREYDRAYAAGDPSFVRLVHPATFDDQAWASGEISKSRYIWVTGLTRTSDCSVDGSRVSCTYVDTSGIDPSRVYDSGTLIFTVERGLITDVDADGYLPPVAADGSALTEYRNWVRSNHPDKFEDLFLFGVTMATETDELVRLQRGMIAQYQEATGKP